MHKKIICTIEIKILLICQSSIEFKIRTVHHSINKYMGVFIFRLNERPNNYLQDRVLLIEIEIQMKSFYNSQLLCFDPNCIYDLWFEYMNYMQ